jgi:hypothetical protein
LGLNVTDADPGPRVADPIVGAIGAEAATAISAGAANSSEPTSTDTDPNAFARRVIAQVWGLDRHRSLSPRKKVQTPWKQPTSLTCTTRRSSTGAGSGLASIAA